MNFIKEFKESLFHINEETFEESSLALFDFQYHNNAIYKLYCDSLQKSPKNVNDLSSIPFLPIEFFKNHAIRSTTARIQKVFKSSGTTGTIRSQHYVSDVDFYHDVSKAIFETHFGSLNDYTLIALLPSYLEQGDSSLIHMVDHLMTYTTSDSGYFLKKEIGQVIEDTDNPLLFGVAYALLDLSDLTITKQPVVIETGGMKGRKKEMIRNELHDQLKPQLNAADIWSEYGMTELMSQAYGTEGLFQFPSWASIQIRAINDPFEYLNINKTGGINVIDLANVDSCAFIETKDIGVERAGRKFEVLGRFDNSEIRGCSLLI